MEIAAVCGALPAHRFTQQMITDAFADDIICAELDAGLLRRVHANAGVDSRYFVLPLEEYGRLQDFGQTNDLYVEHAVEMGSRALVDACKASGLSPSDIDFIACASVTGFAIPTLDARIATVVGLRPDVRRVPLVGLGCVAGASGLARVHDYLVGHPGHVAALVTVEACSLTVQRNDVSVPNLVGSGLFGDGAAAVIARGHTGDAVRGIEVLDNRSRLYPDTERVLGFDVSHNGLRIVLDAQIPALVHQHLPAEVEGFLADNGMSFGDIDFWVCHPGGPKVIDAIRDSLGLDEHDVALTRQSLARIGNLSSASVLHILADTLAERPPEPGSTGILMAMGPGFSTELVLLRAHSIEPTQ